MSCKKEPESLKYFFIEFGRESLILKRKSKATQAISDRA